MDGVAATADRYLGCSLARALGFVGFEQREFHILCVTPIEGHASVEADFDPVIVAIRLLPSNADLAVLTL